MAKKKIEPVGLEMLMPADVQLNPLAFEAGFTQSEMDMWDECPEKWYLKYNLGLRKKGSYALALIYGTWFHAFTEEFYATGGKRWSIDLKAPENVDFRTADELAAFERMKLIAEVQFTIYAAHYKNDHKILKPLKDGIERVITYVWNGVPLRGKLDLECEVKGYANSYHIVDNKTTGRLNRMIVVGWDFRLQFMFYTWLAWKTREKVPGGFVVNAMKKPELRQGKDESNRAYAERLRLDMRMRPEAYFYRERLTVTKRQIERFERETLTPKVLRILSLYDGQTPDELKIPIARNKNTNCCTRYNKVCEFLPICSKGLEVEKFNYEQRPHKHEELDGSGDET